jgi:transposase-like protein
MRHSSCGHFAANGVQVGREKQKRRQYTAEFKRQALERMKVADSIVELAEELGIGRPLLYQWEAASEGRGRKTSRKRQPRSVLEPSEREAALRDEVNWLREALAKKVKEVDFFKGALQKVEVRRQNNANSGAMASTTKSEK